MSNIITVVGWPQTLKLVAHGKLPEYLQERFNHREGVFQTTEDFDCLWRVSNDEVYQCHVPAGLHFDGSSIPWRFRAVGLSRYSRTNWQFAGAITHDPGYQGCGRFPDSSNYRNRQLHDMLARDLWHWAGGGRGTIRFKYRTLRMFGWKTCETNTIHPEPIMEVKVA